MIYKHHLNAKKRGFPFGGSTFLLSKLKREGKVWNRKLGDSPAEAKFFSLSPDCRHSWRGRNVILPKYHLCLSLKTDPVLKTEPVRRWQVE
jgi:hypothetical protein